MPMLLDLSGTMYAALHVDLKGGSTPQFAYIRHLVLNSILTYNKRFKHEYGELIIAMDNGSWRGKYFEEYKWARYNTISKDDHDWEKIYEYMERVCQELIQFFPYPCIRVKYAEGDDVIGTMTDYFTARGERVLIISGDKDMVYKTVHPLCTQYRPIQNIFYEVDDPKKFAFELFVRGDKSDGIPNIFSPNDFIKRQEIDKQNGVKPKRATGVKAKFLEDFWDLYSKPDTTECRIKEFLGEENYNHFVRNRKLISLDLIPDIIRDAIVKAYESAGRNKIMDTLVFMQQNKMHILAQNIKGFEPNRPMSNKLFG